MPEQLTKEQAAREHKRVLLTETREELQKADANASLLLATAVMAAILSFERAAGPGIGT